MKRILQALGFYSKLALKTLLYNKKQYVSLPKDVDPLTVTIADAVKLIDSKRKEDQQKHLKTFEEDAKLEVMNGRYGPYISYDGKNYRIPKNMHDHAKELTFDECMKIVNKANS